MKNLNEVAPRVVKADWLNQIELELRSIKFDEKKDLIGAGEAKKWNLLADAFDPTMLRNSKI